MLTALLVVVGLLPLLYVVFSVYPCVIFHCLNDSEGPEDGKDLLRMTCLPCLFKDYGRK